MGPGKARPIIRRRVDVAEVRGQDRHRAFACGAEHRGGGSRDAAQVFRLAGQHRLVELKRDRAHIGERTHLFAQNARESVDETVEIAVVAVVGQTGERDRTGQRYLDRLFERDRARGFEPAQRVRRAPFEFAGHAQPALVLVAFEPPDQRPAFEPRCAVDEMLVRAGPTDHAVADDPDERARLVGDAERRDFEDRLVQLFTADLASLELARGGAQLLIEFVLPDLGERAVVGGTDHPSIRLRSAAFSASSRSSSTSP